MSTALGDRLLPRIPMLGVALLLASVIGALAVTRGAPRTATPETVPSAQRELRFADRPDGSVAITDARSGAVVEVVPPGGGGFVRGAMRGLARDRRREGGGDGAEQAAPFRLSRWPNGTLTLEDLATGRVVDLRAFGTTNAESFARMLNAHTREGTP